MQLKKRIKAIIEEIDKSSYELSHHSKKADDIYAMSILQPLLTNLPYLPFNGGALRPICMAYILNEIIINQRKEILEFGSGLSTIMIARLIKKNGLNAQLISIEHNKKWSKTLQDYLANENLLQFVKIITVSLKEIETSLGNIKWYDYEMIAPEIIDKKFDFIIVDGPPANEKKIMYSRFPSFFKFEHNLADDFCLILDDANRKGEQELIKYYREHNKNIYYTLVSETLAVFRNTIDFNPIPIHY